MDISVQSQGQLVSIYIPTYNRLHLLKRAVKSVLEQSYNNFELLIVDDGSSDGTKEYLNEISARDQRIRIIAKTGKRGAPASRNLAIKAAAGRFITGLDDDDFFLENRISGLVEAYSPRFSFVFTRPRYRRDFFFSPSCALTKKINFHGLAFFNIVGNQVFIETDRLRSIGGFDEDMPAAQDYDTWLRLTKQFGPAKMLVSHTYVTDANHGSERITDNKMAKVAAYDRIKFKHSDLNKKQLKSFEIRSLEKTGELKFSDFLYDFNFGLSRYFFSYVKDMLTSIGMRRS